MLFYCEWAYDVSLTIKGENVGLISANNSEIQGTTPHSRSDRERTNTSIGFGPVYPALNKKGIRQAQHRCGSKVN